MNWKDIKGLIREELNEETNVTADNTTFIMRTGVNKNPTKLGLKIQFTPKDGAKKVEPTPTKMYGKKSPSKFIDLTKGFNLHLKRAL